MASVAASGIFNALAFASAGYLFKLVDKNKYEVKIKRRNLDMEKLARTKETWYQNLVVQKNKIAELRLVLSDANSDLNTTNKALDNLLKIECVVRQQKIHARTTEGRFLQTVEGNGKIRTCKLWCYRIDQWIGFGICFAV